MPDRGYFAWADRAFDRRAIFDKPEALKGIRIVELCTLILGPATADYLGEFEQLVLLALMRLGESAYGMTIRQEIENPTMRISR